MLPAGLGFDKQIPITKYVVLSEVEAYSLNPFDYAQSDI